MSKLDNSAISKHLGQSSKYKSKYDKELLVREPRANNRKHLDIEDDSLPFVGPDVWNGYEVSALLDNGVPVSLVAKVVYSSDSKYIVESKSMKLYWNSFNMTKLGDSYGEVCESLEYYASRDLSELLETDVTVTVFGPAFVEEAARIENSSVIRDVKGYANIDSVLDDQTKVIKHYSETPDILVADELQSGEVRYHSALLKSNCRVTSQPDWGDVYIFMNGDKIPTKGSLLEYIISFRDECHFHEEICETIYKRLHDKFNPEELSVTCLYCRRGGWDINPQRCSHEHLIEKNLWASYEPWVKTGRQ